MILKLKMMKNTKARSQDPEKSFLIKTNQGQFQLNLKWILRKENKEHNQQSIKANIDSRFKNM